MAGQGRYWVLTIPHEHFTPYLHPLVAYIKGQVELGVLTEYRHWQILVAFKVKQRLRSVKRIFGESCHAELSRSEASNDYVWKEETRIEGTQFELGELAVKRNNKQDWDLVFSKAKSGNFDDIDTDILIRHYSSLKRIYVDYATPTHRGKQEVHIFWGVTGSGKSHTAFELAGDDYYLKSPLTKWFDGYRGQETIIIDEFRGIIDVSHLLKWLDQYPCNVEVKGYQTYLRTKKWIFTSNLNPVDWYPTLDYETLMALRRRFTNVVHYSDPFNLINN